ncbi:Fic family protein [Alkalicoccus luteus]|uniref:Fic family protein n=1 Tax=Alkalicoccus luteus TaxID=1237094 RepID=UPI004033BFFC
MKKPYQLPLLPVTFPPETELTFYKKTVDTMTTLEKLKQRLHYSPVHENFIQLLTLNESVQSTRIEGTQVTFSEMLEDNIDLSADWKRVEVRNYQQALTRGVEHIQSGYPLTERLIREMHDILMQDARGSGGAAGSYRRIQNFVGPSSKMSEASYVPPEPQMMNEYMTNLERYINGHPYQKESEEQLHPLIKSAIIHAQFESIHPFLDGNGRLGRILIVLYLLQERVIDTPTFFLSEELEKERFKYYAMLNGVRAIGKQEPDWKNWILFYLDAAKRMAWQHERKLQQAGDLYEQGLRDLDQLSLQQVWKSFFLHPVANVHQLSETTGLAASTVRKALRTLTDRHMLFGDDRERSRRYYHYDLIRIMTTE